MIKSMNPAGHRVLVLPETVEKVSKGGIVIAHEHEDKKNQAQVIGTLVSVGPTAWKDFGGEAWGKIGDKVMYSKFAGVEVLIDDVVHRVMNDEDIIATVEVSE